MIVERFVLSPFQQNTRIVACEVTKRAVCIDPGEPSPEIAKFIRTNGLELQAVTLTHGHLDHVAGTAFLKEQFPDAEVIIHKDDEDLYYTLPAQSLMLGIPRDRLAAFGLAFDRPPEVTRNWEHGEVYEVGELKFEVRHCPGHTRGHVVLAEIERKKVFVGDCLFWGSIGRTDLPGGDHETLLRSINEQILSLDDDTTVYSGHGPETTVGRERRMNPFLTGTYQIGRGSFI